MDEWPGLWIAVQMFAWGYVKGLVLALGLLPFVLGGLWVGSQLAAWWDRDARQAHERLIQESQAQTRAIFARMDADGQAREAEHQAWMARMEAQYAAREAEREIRGRRGHP